MPANPTYDLNAAPLGGTAVTFNEETQRHLRLQALRRAAMAFGMAALADKAVDSGDYDQIDLMRYGLQELGEELTKLADLFGQMAVQNAA